MHIIGSKKVFFLNVFDDGIDAKSGEVISLTHLASNHLTKSGIPFTILNDYCSEKELLKFGDEYFQDQLKWFFSFDEFLRHILYKILMRPMSVYLAL